jgi:hypothetical protein
MAGTGQVFANKPHNDWDCPKNDPLQIATYLISHTAGFSAELDSVSRMFCWAVSGLLDSQSPISNCAFPLLMSHR